MKVNIDYTKYHQAVRKFEAGEELTPDEKTTLVDVLNAVVGEYVPSEAEMDNHARNLQRLQTLNYATNKDELKAVMDACREHENKYY
jgi:hypothetical protein